MTRSEYNRAYYLANREERLEYSSEYHKDVRRGIRVPHKSLRERFLDKIVKRDDCWVWCAFIDQLSRPIFKLRGKTTVACRASYEIFIGPIPEGRTVRRTCGDLRCVAPEHIELRPLKVKKPRKKMGPNDIHKHWTVEDGYRALARAIGLLDDSPRRIAAQSNRLHNVYY